MSDALDFPVHPLADLLPPLSESEYRELVDDIRTHGLRDPIDLLHGAVLDGRHRLLACRDAGVTPSVRILDDDTNAVAFVLSRNLLRRHLTAGQRAMLAARLRDQLTTAKADTSRDDGVDVDRHQRETNAIIGEAVGVSGRSVDDAVKVLADGIDELATLVDAGEVGVRVAATVATLPADEQREVVARGAHVVNATAERVRAAKRKPTPVCDALASLVDAFTKADGAIRQAGGMAKVAAAWDDDARELRRADLQRIATGLSAWLTLLASSEEE